MAGIILAAAIGSCFPVAFVFHKTTTSDNDLADLQLLGPRSRLSPTTAAPALGRPLDFQVGVLGFTGAVPFPLPPPPQQFRQTQLCLRKRLRLTHWLFNA